MSIYSSSNQPIITQTQISCSTFIVIYNELFAKIILPFIREIRKNLKKNVNILLQILVQNIDIFYFDFYISL